MKPLSSSSPPPASGDTVPPPVLSVLLPAHNEEGGVQAVVRETAAVLRRMGRPFEILVVDDASTDATAERLQALSPDVPELRILRLEAHAGQSAALGAAFREARGGILVTLDADGQNDPADIPALVAQLDTCDACCGVRIRRCDAWSRRVGSRLANAVRNAVLRESIRGTGCTLKAFRAVFAPQLPMQFRGMQRFLPALLAMQGARITELPVGHRPRAADKSHYTNRGRLRECLVDLGAVRWMQKRWRSTRTTAIR